MNTIKKKSISTSDKSRTRARGPRRFILNNVSRKGDPNVNHGQLDMVLLTEDNIPFAPVQLLDYYKDNKGRGIKRLAECILLDAQMEINEDILAIHTNAYTLIEENQRLIGYPDKAVSGPAYEILKCARTLHTNTEIYLADIYKEHNEKVRSAIDKDRGENEDYQRICDLPEYTKYMHTKLGLNAIIKLYDSLRDGLQHEKSKQAFNYRTKKMLADTKNITKIMKQELYKLIQHGEIHEKDYYFYGAINKSEYVQELWRMKNIKPRQFDKDAREIV